MSNQEKSTLTRMDLSEAIRQRLGNSKVESAALVDLIFETVASTLTRGEEIKISGFGNFEVHEKASRRGRNPQTGEDLDIAAKRVVRFHCSRKLREQVNQEIESEEA